MSWYYRRYNYRKRRDFEYNYSKSPYWQSFRFIKECFFSFNRLTFLKFVNYYVDKYGEGPKNYLIKTYPKWKSGEVNLSSQSGIRLLKCVPKFLTIDEKFEILKFYLPEIAEGLRNSISRKSVNLSDINKLYYHLSNKCLQFSYGLDWFASGVFTNDEIKELINVLKFAMLNRIIKSYNDVKSDIRFIYNIFLKVDIDYAMEFNYRINFLNCLIKLDDFSVLNRNLRFPTLDRPNLATDYREKFKKILLNHSLKLSLEEDKTKYNHHFIVNDVKKLLSYLSNLKKSQEFDSNIKVDGKGGVANIHFYKKNILRLHSEIVLATIKFFASILITGVIFWVLIEIGIGWIIIYFAIGALSLIGSFGSKILQKRSEVKEYEQRRKVRFTEN